MPVLSVQNAAAGCRPLVGHRLVLDHDLSLLSLASPGVHHVALVPVAALHLHRPVACGGDIQKKGQSAIMTPCSNYLLP